MRAFINIIRKLFYNPERHFRRLPFVQLAPSALLYGCRLVFALKEKDFQGRVTIGQNTIFGGEIIFESNQGLVIIGDNCFVNGGTKLISRHKIQLGNNVTIAWGCTIYDHNSHSLDHRHRQEDSRQQVYNLNHGLPLVQNKNWDVVKGREIVIEDNAWIGFDTIILSGVTIGEGAIIGAGSVVRQNVEAWTVVAGNPATLVRRLQ